MTEIHEDDNHCKTTVKLLHEKKMPLHQKYFMNDEHLLLKVVREDGKYL